MSYFALVPAAGGGARMGAALPKQYLPLGGAPVLHHTIAALCAVQQIERVFVVLSPKDDYWQRYDGSQLPAHVQVLRCGGQTRADSVRNGLTALQDVLKPDDWVLVHDAARACLSPALVEKLIVAVADDSVGGLLALPVIDTIKRAEVANNDPGLPRVSSTVDRADLWLAQTPQMFRYGLLYKALQQSRRRTASVTDEASAVETLGLQPLLVEGDSANLKITWPQDLALAAALLELRARL